MNGEIPSVPITTLAGISSLTDLLPEMPLPSPLPQTMSNKSLLFHPRVAEEAHILLSLRDDTLVPQLAQSLNQSAAINIELKDHYTSSETSNVDQQNIPELLKAILFCDPEVFNGFHFHYNKRTSKTVNCKNEIPSSIDGENVIPTPPLSEKIKIQKTLNCKNEVPSSIDGENVIPTPPLSEKNKIQKTVNCKNEISSSIDGENVIPTPPLSGSSPEQTSVSAPLAQVCEPSLVPSIPSQDSQTVICSLEDKDQIKRSLKEYHEKFSPSCNSEKYNFHNTQVHSSESENEKQEPQNRSKIFKAREKERALAKRKERGKSPNDDQNKVADKSDRGKRRKRSLRSSGSVDKKKEVEESAPKAKLRKMERKLVPVLEKLSVEELMETNTYQRFNRSLEKIFEDVEDVMINESDEDEECCDSLIPKYHLQDLCAEAAKLKTLGAMESIPTDKTTRLLTILERNIRDGSKVTPISDPNDGEDERKLFVELAMERVMRAVDASLTALYILTSPNMHKQVYLEDVIDRIIIFTKYQLHNTVFPVFDPVYRVQSKDKDGYLGSGRKKRGQSKEVREKTVLLLYQKLTEVVTLLAELLDIQKLTDNAVLHASSMGISPFFVEGVSDLQLSSLKLVTTIFSKYEKHRKLLLDDILASMARLPSSKRSLRSYRLNVDEQIQMLTALVLQLVQCMVVLPHNLDNKQECDFDPDVIIVSKFKTARSTASNFLYVFLNKCSSKSEEIDYRPLFENFVQDLLTTVNKPEWPAAELMLSVLGNLLVNNFVNKSLEMSLRVASLDYLGVVAARLRKDAVVSQLKLSTIDQIIKEVQMEEMKDEEGYAKGDIKPVENDEERTQFLQRVLLDYLAMRGQQEPVLSHARHFYLAQWYQDNCVQISSSTSKKPSKKKKKSGRRKLDSSEEDLSSEEEDVNESKVNEDPVEAYRQSEVRKRFLLSKIRPFEDRVSTDGTKTHILQTYIDYGSAELVARYLASKRPFSQSFDVYLKHILKVLTETSVLIRTKAMKCLTSIVEVDPGVLGLKEMQLGVSHSFLDHSTSVREAAVDLVGKFILSRPELIPKYYDMLSARILDTGVSVRKRVIKILKDVCIECPDFPKIPEICVKIIRRVNDEDGIRKLVLEVFQNMWFTPVKERPVLDSDALVRKVMNITDVVAASNDISIEWFEQLLLSLFKPREDKEETVNKVQVEVPRSILVACRQIVDCLVETVIQLDNNDGDPQRLVSCLIMLNLFAKIRPQLLVVHATTLQPYLSLKCKTQGDYQVISCVARTLELVVPLIEHPSEMFLSRLEEDSVKLMMQQDPSVVLSCVSCLGSIVNNVTRNFPLIRDCLKKYHGFLKATRAMLENNTEGATAFHLRMKPSFRRSLFVVGLLLRFFDFTDPEVIGDQLPSNIKDEVIDTFLYFLHRDQDSQHYTMKALGSVCIRHYELMLTDELKSLYHQYLSDENAPLQMKVQVLNNIESYLLEEEKKMIKQDQEWAKLSKRENLKEMGDVTSGMASTVIQIYLREILEAFLHPHPAVRNSALKVIQLILAQGLVHPVQIVPYLICMSTDEDKTVSSSADKQLQEIEKKYPGFIHMKAQAGIRLSYKLHKILQCNDIVRGYRLKDGDIIPSALNGFLYSILRTKQQRRALVMSILKQFDEQAKLSLLQMLYLADNMAYFPYQVQDEPLFIIHHIDIILSVTGTNLLQSFREALLPLNPEGSKNNEIELDEEEDEDEETLLSRLPEDTTPLQHCLTASQGCLLLLVLKQHLKTMYGFNDAKITQYSPTESAKTYEKSVTRKCNAKFNPKAIIQKLMMGTPPNQLDEAARRSLVSEYLEFKNLINDLDPDDPDDDDDNASPQKSSDGTPYSGRVREFIAKRSEQTNSDQQAGSQSNDGSNNTPTVPKLTLIATKGLVKQTKSRKTERHKKHHHKRKKKYKSSEESENDYSDPDFSL
ncbi:unnamed protein product [Nezara viridula]|uniref:Nipped-B protein n=1 Tax=Nezara viridula TaxID=85310 RepID=A0A9P0EBW3_NEZVI|nr:unnamed protein product [Nezara viridula]